MLTLQLRTQAWILIGKLFDVQLYWAELISFCINSNCKKIVSSKHVYGASLPAVTTEMGIIAFKSNVL